MLKCDFFRRTNHLKGETMKSFKGLISKIQEKNKELESDDKLKKKLKILVTQGYLYSFFGFWWGGALYSDTSHPFMS